MKDPGNEVGTAERILNYGGVGSKASAGGANV